MSWPKPKYSARQRKRKRDREVNRRDVAAAVRGIDGRCMNIHCPMVRYQNISSLEAAHVENRRPHNAALDSPENMITLCIRCHDMADGRRPAVDHNGNKLTARQFMLYVLEFHVGTERWRWEEQYQRLKRMEG